MLLSDIVRGAAAKRPDHPALVFGGTTLTFAQLAERVARAAGGLEELIAPGDRVALLADNCTPYLELMYAAPAAGGILTIVNQRLSGPEIRVVLEDSEPTVLLVGDTHLERVQPVLADVPSIKHVIVIGDDVSGRPTYAQLIEHPPKDLYDVAAVDSDTAWLIYTSGTTGRPKGAMLTHRNLLTAILTGMAEWLPTRDDRQLFCLPLCHVAAFVPLMAHLRTATVVLTAGFDPGEVLELVERHRITQTNLAPTMLAFVLDHPGIDTTDTSSLTLLAYGAAPMSPALLKRGIARFGEVFLQGFGQTEVAGTAVLTLGVEEHRRAAQGETELLAALGRPTPFSEVRLVDDQLSDVEVGDVGEIVVRGDQVMAGYWRNPEATEHSRRGGWHHTGDLGRRDAEGLVYFVGRADDTINTGAENVYPREVEDVLAGHPAVAEAAVLGLPDETWGETVVAVVALRAGATVDATALSAHCRGSLAGYKIPRRIEIIDALPRNAAGKVLKRELRRQLGDS